MFSQNDDFFNNCLGRFPASYCTADVPRALTLRNPPTTAPLRTFHVRSTNYTSTTSTAYAFWSFGIFPILRYPTWLRLTRHLLLVISQDLIVLCLEFRLELLPVEQVTRVSCAYHWQSQSLAAHIRLSFFARSYTAPAS